MFSCEVKSYWVDINTLNLLKPIELYIQVMEKKRLEKVEPVFNSL